MKTMIIFEGLWLGIKAWNQGSNATSKSWNWPRGEITLWHKESECYI